MRENNSYWKQDWFQSAMKVVECKEENGQGILLVSVCKCASRRGNARMSQLSFSPWFSFHNKTIISSANAQGAKRTGIKLMTEYCNIDYNWQASVANKHALNTSNIFQIHNRQRQLEDFRGGIRQRSVIWICVRLQCSVEVHLKKRL